MVGQALFGGQHGIAPDIGGQGASGDAPGGRRIVIADPGGGDIIGGEAHEPGVMGILRGAGLAGGFAAMERGIAAGAADHHAIKHGGEIAVDAFRDHARRRCDAAMINRLATHIHLRDHIRRDAMAAIGEGGIGRGQFQHRHFVGAQRQRSIGLQRRGDADTFGRFHHIAYANLLREVDRYGVDAVGQRVRHGLGAIIFAAKIGGTVTVDIDGFIVAGFPGTDAGFQRRQIDKGFEGRAGLAMRLGGAVEHRIPVIDAADHGADRAIRLHHHQGSLAGAGFLAVFVDGAQRRQPCGLLHLRLQGGVNHHVRAGRGAVHRRQPRGFVGGAVQEIIARIQADAVDDLGGMGTGLGRLLFANGAVVHHGIQHQGGALLSPQQVAAGREDRGRAREGRQHRGLRQSQLTRAGAEIGARRAVDAIGGAAQIDAIEIKLQDLLLGKGFFQSRGIHQFRQLARHGAFLVGVDDFRGLLADGGAARHPLARLEIEQQRPRQSHRIDAIVIVEAPVFHGDKGGGQIGGHLLQLQPFAHHGAAVADFLSSHVQKGEGQGAIDGIEIDSGIEPGRHQT